MGRGTKAQTFRGGNRKSRSHRSGESVKTRSPLLAKRERQAMREFILCSTALCMILWIVYLKLEVGTLSEKVNKLAELLKRYLKDKTTDVEVAQELESWKTKSKP
jgi:hypothetical protein